MNPSIMMLLSALGPLLGGFGGENAEQSSTFTGGQRSLLDQVMNQIKGRGGSPDINQNPQYQQGQEFLNSLFNDPSFFQNIESPAIRNFQESTVPELANRFGAMGSGGSTSSTAFRNALGRAGVDLQTNLAANRGQMQQLGANQALGYSQQPFNQFAQLLGLTTGQGQMNQYKPPTPGPFGDILSSLSGGAAQGFGQKMGQQFAGQFPGTY